MRHDRSLSGSVDVPGDLRGSRAVGTVAGPAQDLAAGGRGGVVAAVGEDHPVLPGRDTSLIKDAYRKAEGLALGRLGEGPSGRAPLTAAPRANAGETPCRYRAGSRTSSIRAPEGRGKRDRRETSMRTVLGLGATFMVRAAIGYVISPGVSNTGFARRRSSPGVRQPRRSDDRTDHRRDLCGAR